MANLVNLQEFDQQLNQTSQSYQKVLEQNGRLLELLKTYESIMRASDDPTADQRSLQRRRDSIVHDAMKTTVASLERLGDGMANLYNAISALAHNNRDGRG